MHRDATEKIFPVIESESANPKPKPDQGWHIQRPKEVIIPDIFIEGDRNVRRQSE